MAKFSDLPYYILNEYFSALITDATYVGSFSSYIIGTRSGIVADGGYWTKLYTKDSTTGDFVGHKFRIVEIDGNFFTFDYGSLTSGHSLATSIITNGSEVFFRKDSYFHDYLLSNESSYKNYANTDKHFLYFGNIYSTGTTDRYNIKFNGMKDFVKNALPVNNQTANLVEFLDIYFDKEHQEIYNLTKTLWSLIDPKEVNIDYLAYISNMYGMEINETLSVLPLREWVDNTIYFLKRKGTYASIYIIWKILTGGTNNTLQVFERWHDASVIIPVESDFDDYPYQMFYSGEGTAPSGCVAPNGGGYYSQTGEYPDVGSYSVSAVGDPIGELSQWSVKHNLNTTNVIVQAYNENSEMIWPLTINITSNNEVLLTFATTLTGTANVVAADYSHDPNVPIATWNINHSLSQKEVLSQYFNNSNNQIWPSTVTLSDINNMVVTWNSPLDGRGNVKEAGYIHTQAAANSTWTINHNQIRNVLVSFYDNSYVEIMPDTVTTAEGSVIATFGSAITGYAMVESAGYSLEQSESGYVLSPHYKVEIDLNCEPFGDNYIINQSLLDELYKNWEYTRPVSRFAHYRELVSPKVDLSKTYIDVYGNEYTASMNSAFTGSAYVSAATASSSGSYGDNYEHIQDASSMEWNINHNLNTVNVLTQAYDDDNELIYPAEHEIVNANNVKLSFNNSVRGSAYTISLGTSGYTHTQATTATEWEVVHNFDKRETVSQFFNNKETNERIWPLNVAPSGNGNGILATWTTSEELAPSGTALVGKADYTHTQATSATTWIINHNLQTDGILVQCYNADWYQVVPKTVTLTTSNQCTIEFDHAIDGYACIIFLSETYQDETAIDMISKWIIGSGTTDEYDPVVNNSVETMVTSGSSFTEYSDVNYWYFDWLWESNEEASITEIGLLDINDNLMFYTTCDPIYKSEEFDVQLHFRISKTEI